MRFPVRPTVRRPGAKATLTLGTVVIAAGYGLRLADSRQLWAVIAGAAVVSVGTALAYSALPMLIMRAVPLEQTAAANGLNVLMRTIGQALCSAVVATVLAQHTRVFADVSGVAVAAPTLDGYRVAFAAAGAVALLACAAARLIPRQPRPVPSPSRRLNTMPGPSSASPATAVRERRTGTRRHRRRRRPARHRTRRHDRVTPTRGARRSSPPPGAPSHAMPTPTRPSPPSPMTRASARRS